MSAPEAPDGGGDGGTIIGGTLYDRWQPPPPEALTPRRLELRRLGDNLRDVIDRLVSTDAPVEQITAAADQLERIAREFEHVANASVYEGFAEATIAGPDVHALFDQSPFIGRANPLAPPIRIWEDGGEVAGEVTFGAAYEGPPGCVHGGYVAGAFDEVLGATQTLSGRAGMTGTLTTVYRSPTPLHTPLRFRGWITGTERRKILTAATLHAGDRLCAEATAIFISIDVEVFARLREEREARERPRGA